LVKLILRNKEFEVKPGMTLLSALQKINVVPESVIATREGEMILEDEILKDGDVIKLIAVISGGSCHCEGGVFSPEAAKRPVCIGEIASHGDAAQSSQGTLLATLAPGASAGVTGGQYEM
jgi:sulfur carrier protein